jgi:hypothetical protein
MLRLAADENFNNDIVRGLFRVRPTIDLVRVQDTEVAGASDSTLLEWAATEGRILLTHDERTVPRWALHRVEAGFTMPGVFVVRRTVAVSQVIEDLLLLAECSLDDEWHDRICYLPLRNCPNR